MQRNGGRLSVATARAFFRDAVNGLQVGNNMIVGAHVYVEVLYVTPSMFLFFSRSSEMQSTVCRRVIVIRAHECCYCYCRTHECLHVVLM
jgi:hypothetical protein